MRYARASLIALTTSCALGALVFAQSPSSFTPPRMPDGKPDFTGTYQWPTYLPGAQRGRSAATVFDSRNFAPLKPGGEPFFEPRTGDPRHDEPRDYCLPAGFPGSILSGNAMQWFQTKTYLTIVHEFQRNTRIIPLDGRPHPGPAIKMYMGDAKGHWEGNTLVVETTNFTDKTAYRGSSDSLKLTERFKPVAPDTVEWSVTFDDPHTWARSWTFAMNLAKKDDSQRPFEYACNEGNYGMVGILNAARAEEKAGHDVVSPRDAEGER